MYRITFFLEKLRYYFFKVINDLREKKFDTSNSEQNIYIAVIMIIFGIFGLMIVDE
jgi:hypothetical protein